MATHSSYKAIKTLWSYCSIDKFNELLKDPKALSCLKTAVRKTIYAHAICGNGILEGSEQCDCGSVEVSSPSVTCVHHHIKVHNMYYTLGGKDPCCDARTCRLKKGSKC